MARHPPPRAGAVPGRGPHDNGVFRPHRDVPFSRVIEIERASGTIAWEYHDPARESFFAPFMGSAQRLPNGNTLVTDSPRAASSRRIARTIVPGALVTTSTPPAPSHPSLKVHTPRTMTA